MLTVIVLSLWLPAASADDRSPLIAVFTKNTTNPAYENFRIGADKAAAALGARTRHYVPVKPDNVDEQKQLVEQALADKPDAVVFVPVDDVAMVETMRRFADAKIPVATAVSRISGQAVTFVGADDVEVGYREARYLLQALGGEGKVVEIDGIASSPTSRDRKRGFERALKEFPKVELLGSGVGNYQSAEARRVMAEMLKAYPRIDGIIAANDVMALAALDVLREAGRTARVVGANGVVDAVRQIEAGTLLASVDFNTFKFGCIAVEAVMRSRAGGRVPETIMLPADIIAHSNFAAWLVPSRERACPTWDDIVSRP